MVAGVRTGIDFLNPLNPFNPLGSRDLLAANTTKKKKETTKAKRKSNDSNDSRWVVDGSGPLSKLHMRKMIGFVYNREYNPVQNGDVDRGSSMFDLGFKLPVKAVNFSIGLGGEISYPYQSAETMTSSQVFSRNPGNTAQLINANLGLLATNKKNNSVILLKLGRISNQSLLSDYNYNSLWRRGLDERGERRSLNALTRKWSTYQNSAWGGLIGTGVSRGNFNFLFQLSVSENKRGEDLKAFHDWKCLLLNQTAEDTAVDKSQTGSDSFMDNYMTSIRSYLNWGLFNLNLGFDGGEFQDPYKTKITEGIYEARGYYDRSFNFGAGASPIFGKWTFRPFVAARFSQLIENKSYHLPRTNDYSEQDWNAGMEVEYEIGKYSIAGMKMPLSITLGGMWDGLRQQYFDGRPDYKLNSYVVAASLNFGSIENVNAFARGEYIYNKAKSRRYSVEAGITLNLDTLFNKADRLDDLYNRLLGNH